MRKWHLTFIVASVLTLAVTVNFRQIAKAQNSNVQPAAGVKAGKPERALSFVTNMPSGYRDWKLISVAREEDTLDDIRAILGNDIAIKAYREETRPFPEGAIIARIAWRYEASEENNKAFGKAQSFVAAAPKNGVQFMIKDSKNYAATGGWRYAQFYDGKPAEESSMQSCYPCHQGIRARDFIFTRYAL